MPKIIRMQASKLIVFIVISLLVTTYFAPLRTILAAQPSDETIAQPMHISKLVDSYALAGYSPSLIRTAYGVPASGGAGATIAIIDAYDTSNITNDLSVFSNQFNLPPPTISNFKIHKMSSNLGTVNGWSLEACLDVEWAHAIAPNATILLVEATSANSNDLLSAVSYAESQPGVVAVSMSWGGNEFSTESMYDQCFNGTSGIVFFASSGDNGAGVTWPSCSPNVVAVGGTTLSLNSNSSVFSEMAWSGSGGGISAYEALPSYQSSFGLTYSGRAVPDVSYDANPSTGFAVYYGSSWYEVGGTSAGPPQWAAIQALGLSATNINLYKDANLTYSSYFRDITSGSNGAYNATIGYDCVTGLGSPITANFGSLTVSPTSGPAGGSITLNGIGFTANSSVSISYLNPATSAWTPIIENLTASPTEDFNYTFSAPDLLQNNPAGDDQSPLCDSIVFQALDISSGNLYNTSIPFTEWRKGLIQVGNTTATGLYGNDTNLATNTFVQNGQSIILVGKWFAPGSASLLWDDTINLGTATIDETGFFNTTILVPATSAGQHMITINDGSSNFCVNLTRLPAINNDYNSSWHTTDFTINLTPDYNDTETYYSINNGPVYNVTSNGQPVIDTEGNNNTLDYWGIWNIYGTGTMEIQPVTLTGIRLDETPPQGAFQINNGSTSTSSSSVSLTLSANDSVSGISQMRFSNDNAWDQTAWVPYANTTSWQLSDGDGVKTVYCQIQDNAGLITTLSSSIILSTSQDLPSPPPLTNLNLLPSPSPSDTTSSTYAPTFTPTQIPSVTASPSSLNKTSSSPELSQRTQVPELSFQVILVLIVLSGILFAINWKRKASSK